MLTVFRAAATLYFRDRMSQSPAHPPTLLVKNIIRYGRVFKEPILDSSTFSKLHRDKQQTERTSGRCGQDQLCSMQALQPLGKLATDNVKSGIKTFALRLENKQAGLSGYLAYIHCTCSYQTAQRFQHFFQFVLYIASFQQW